MKLEYQIILFYYRCNCKKCSVQNLATWEECYCCCELEECKESLTSEIVVQDLVTTDNITCVTQHPGFKPVCLEKWSLRMAAWTYKTKRKERYKQKSNEERLVIRGFLHKHFDSVDYFHIFTCWRVNIFEQRKRIHCSLC